MGKGEGFWRNVWMDGGIGWDRSIGIGISVPIRAQVSKNQCGGVPPIQNLNDTTTITVKNEHVS